MLKTNKVLNRKNILGMLLCCLLCAVFAPLQAHADEANDKLVMSGISGLMNYETDTSKQGYFGGYEIISFARQDYNPNATMLWAVLAYSGGNGGTYYTSSGNELTDEESQNVMFLRSVTSGDYPSSGTPASLPIANTSNDNIAWSESKVKAALDYMAEDLFPSSRIESSVVLYTSKASSSSNANDALDKSRFFALSLEEATNTAYHYSSSMGGDDNRHGVGLGASGFYGSSYRLRTSYDADSNYIVDNSGHWYDYGSIKLSNDTNYTTPDASGTYIHPSYNRVGGINIDGSKILFTIAFDIGFYQYQDTSSLNEVKTYSDYTSGTYSNCLLWKLVLADDNDFNDYSRANSNIIADAGDAITINHKAPSSISSEYNDILGVIKKGDEVVYYGSLGSDMSKDSTTFTVPQLDNGIYTLELYAQTSYDDDASIPDYSNVATGTPVSVTLTVGGSAITYKDGNDTFSSFKQDASVPYTYVHGTGVTLPAAGDIYKEGYTFLGWYDNADLTGESITEIKATETGNKTYWAKWQKTDDPNDPTDPTEPTDPSNPSDPSSPSAPSNNNASADTQGNALAATGDSTNHTLLVSLLAIAAGASMAGIALRRYSS